MSIRTVGYSKNSVAYTYTTFESAQTAGANGDIILMFYSGTNQKREWSNITVSKNLELYAMLPFRGLMIRAINSQAATLSANFSGRGVNNTPNFYASSGTAATFQCCAGHGEATNSIFYLNYINATMICQSCASVGANGFKTNSVSGAHLYCYNCSDVYDGAQGYYQSNAVNGLMHLYDCMSAYARLRDYNDTVDINSGDNCVGTDGDTSNTANITNMQWYTGTDNPLKMRSEEPARLPTPSQPYHVNYDSPLIGRGQWRAGYTLPYDIDYLPWKLQPSIGCSRGVRDTQRYRIGYFGNTRLNYRISADTPHPDAPWIRFAMYCKD